MKRRSLTCLFAGWLSGAGASAAPVPADLSQVKRGPVLLERPLDPVAACEKCGQGLDRREYRLIAYIAAQGRRVLGHAPPLFRAVCGERYNAAADEKAAYDAFPATLRQPPPAFHPDGSRRFRGSFLATSARVRTLGDRVEGGCGRKAGIFKGGIAL